MLDLTLGTVDIGDYNGPLLDGRPLHGGSCEDSPYGCRKCNAAARMLKTEQLVAIGWPVSDSCDWCKKDVPSQEISGLRPYDEPSIYYEVCDCCYRKYQKDLEELIAEEQPDEEDQPGYLCSCPDQCDADECDGEVYHSRCITYSLTPGLCGWCKRGHR
jgi:hypothetical protein